MNKLAVLILHSNGITYIQEYMLHPNVRLLVNCTCVTLMCPVQYGDDVLIL